VLSLILIALLQSAPTQTPHTDDPKKPSDQKSWAGCVQAGSTPETFRLNLDQATGSSGATESTSLGAPFIQLLTGARPVDLTSYVGKHVRVTGRQLSAKEAEQEAAARPDQQEANETAAGTGGRPQRHLRYVRVESISVVQGVCRSSRPTTRPRFATSSSRARHGSTPPSTPRSPAAS